MPLLLCMAEQSRNHPEPKQSYCLSAELARLLLDQAQAFASRSPMPIADASHSLTLGQDEAIHIDVVRIPAEALGDADTLVHTPAFAFLTAEMPSACTFPPLTTNISAYMQRQ